MVPTQASVPSSASAAKASNSGIMLFWIGLSVAGSAFAFLRLEIGGRLVHPYLFPMTAACLVVALPKLRQFPRPALTAMCAFALLYFASCMQSPQSWMGEFLKISAAGLTIVTAALLVRNREDFHLGSFGLILGMGVLAMYAAITGNDGGTITPMELGNKNAFSLYSLPVLLLCGYLLLSRNWSALVKTLFYSCALAMLACIFLSGNRSGWLGAVL
ncbi:MAG: hypothetical protein N2C14_23285, partial [Planctomycetales bacterium]